MNLVKEYWLWVLIPFVIVVGGIAVLYWMADGATGSDLIYNVF